MRNGTFRIGCKNIRSWLYSGLLERVGLGADWVQSHIASCPRCQRRLAFSSKVNLALALTKSQPHKLELLMRANTQAIKVLKHSLRECPKADQLKSAIPQPHLLDRISKYKYAVANVAACLIVLVLMKSGIFSSVERFQSKGEQAVKQYYASRVGSDIVDDIFLA